MQVNSPSPITLIYPDKSEASLRIYGGPNDSREIFINWGKNIHPIAFKWPDSHLRPLTPKLINWLQTDFKAMFDTNAFLWMASVATVDPKFQPILKDLFND